MISHAKNISAARVVEDVVGCKWSLAVLGLVRSGVLAREAQRELESPRA